MLKKSSSLALMLTLAVGVSRFMSPAAGTPRQAGAAASASKAPGKLVHPLLHSKTKTAAPNFVGGCTAYLPKSAAVVPPYDDNQGTAKEVLDTFFASETPYEPSKAVPAAVRYGIVLAPDPRHTHLGFMFDREIALVAQAAEDNGYVYNSSWLPWKNEGPDSLDQLSDEQMAAKLREEREACPGIILFRKALDNTPSAASSYAGALMLFVVGEQPTGGINEDQWTNATRWLTANASIHQATDATHGDGVLRVLGPTFTGSLVSLARNLDELYKTHRDEKDKSEFQKRFSNAWILSGSVSGCNSIHWFQQHLPAPNPSDHVYFGSFQENDSVHIARLVEYLGRQGVDAADTAILSEDETAYGENTYGESSGYPDPCNQVDNKLSRPLHVIYPRDISALRDAYEKQSVFESGDASQKHLVLKITPDDNARADDTGDTIPSLGGATTAMDEEAYLYGLVSVLRIHHTHVLILRCTNPLDSMFLTRFFHRAYPQARIASVGADLLFGREIDSTEFRGVLSLSSYPLLPRNEHWSMITEDDWDSRVHNDLVFQSHLQEGMYIAGLYLLQARPPVSGGEQGSAGLVMERSIHTPDYSDPFWFAKGPDETAFDSHPPTWLSAVGRDGYWPVAILRSDAGNHSTMVDLQAIKARKPHYELAAENDLKHHKMPLEFGPHMRGSMPMPWLACGLLSLALICYQIWGLGQGGIQPSDGLLSPFRIAQNPGQSLLLGISCALAITLLFELTLHGVLLTHRYPSISSDYSIQIGFGLACFILAIALTLLVTRGGHKHWRYGLLSAVCCSATLCMFFFLYRYALQLTRLGSQDDSNTVSLFYRATHLTDGVSPLLPLLLLTLGFYFWNWQLMAGNLMLAKGCPTLPLFVERKGRLTQWVAWLGEANRRISQYHGDEITEIAQPLFFPFRIMVIPYFLIFVGYICFVYRQLTLPLLSFESIGFNKVVNGLLLLALLLTVAEAVRLYATWTKLRNLLRALGRLRLRRTIAALRVNEMRSVWSVSSSFRRVQYDLFVQQLDAATRLMRLQPLTFLEPVISYGKIFREEVETSGGPGACWEVPVRLNEHEARYMRDVLSEAAGAVFGQLEKEWEKEEESLNLGNASPEKSDEADPVRIPLSESPKVRVAEEFLAYHYIAFIQNISARMRTMALSMIFLFITVCFAISFYPFVPRTEIAIWLLLNLAIIGSVVAYVYAGMDRDEILSYIAQTRPGHLGVEFWVKISAFLAGPIIGLLTTQFPSLADAALRWLQPGLDAIK